MSLSRILPILLSFWAPLLMAQGARPAPTVIVAPAKSMSVGERLELPATVLARESVVISSSVADTVAAIHFDDGDRVEKGDLLLELRHAAELADLRAAEARQIEKQRSLKRLRELASQGLASDAELDLARAELQTVDAEIEALKADVADRKIHAPFAGVLGLREVSPGAFVSAGQTLTVLQDLSRLRLEFELPQANLARLGPDLTMEAWLPEQPQQRVPARLDGHAGQLDYGSRSLRLRASLEQAPPHLLPGSLMLLALSSGQREALMVPEAALIPQGASYTLYRLEGDKVRQQAVVIGLRRNGQVEIREGVSAGDRVVIHGGQKLRDGAQVRVLAEFDGSVPIAELIRRERP